WGPRSHPRPRGQRLRRRTDGRPQRPARRQRPQATITAEAPGNAGSRRRANLKAEQTRFHKKIYTYRIRREKYGYYTIETAEGVRRELFPNLNELISKYQKPNQGLVIRLCYPVEKNNVYQSSTNLQAASVYANSSSDDYVEPLP
uniref:SH2 domain-containing protein n=1 Tax=Monodelphis domestica TaxID=13616 RepID=A0A5F8H900_MONDO